MNAAVATEVQADLTFREERRKYLGGSDIAAMLGCAPPNWRRNTPLALYLDKIEPPKPDTQGRSYKRRGKRWEAVVGEMLIEKLEERGHKVEIVTANKRYRDPDFNFFACEIDYEIRLDGEEEITNVELKTVHPYKVAEWGEEDTDASPVWYTAQGQWGLGITRRRRCIIAPLFGADEIRVYPMLAANDVIADIRETGRKFWTENVLARVPPLPGGLIDLARLFPNDCGRTVDFANNEAFVDALTELRAADEDFDRAKTRWDAAEFVAKEIMGEVAVATIGGHKACSWKTQKDRRVDVTRLKEERPDIYNEFLREADIRKFLLSRSKK
ncbi:MAG TPA: YqaJ viral recombinase family protein [Steroidobacteraceae bacterium]|nr:YqaJ viral recombinase family protein [Steroidobacteraceae bacterium]